jgi:hypothetical protein
MTKKRSTSNGKGRRCKKQTSLLSFWAPLTTLKFTTVTDAATKVHLKFSNGTLSSVGENTESVESHHGGQLSNACENAIIWAAKAHSSQTISTFMIPAHTVGVSSMPELPHELHAEDREEVSCKTLIRADKNNDVGINSVLSINDLPSKYDEVMANPQNNVTNQADDSPLSEYEKLRLRNIERNNTRLAALGLLHNVSTNGAKGSSNNATKRKRSAMRSDNVRSKPRPPARRSTRNRKNAWTENSTTDSSTTGTDDTRLSQDKGCKVTLDTADSLFTYSPLYHYSSMNVSTQTTGSDMAGMDFSNMMTLRVTGQRCVSPKGLSAIYSLDISGTLKDNSCPQQKQVSWLVGAGKAGMISLWNINHSATRSCPAKNDDWAGGCAEFDSSISEPIMAWKAHSGRWIADAKFVPDNDNLGSPQRLLTAGNDGTICWWDLCRTCDDVPKLLFQSDIAWHSSGIFCLDVGSASDSTMICTGSKDKTIALSNMEAISGGNCVPTWRSSFHSAKVGSVQLKGRQTSVLASASDDRLVGIHDYRMNGGNKTSIVAQLEYAHQRPHSVVWDPTDVNILVTAGMDPCIKLWDWRNLSQPLATMEGHVPVGRPCNKIHRPVFMQTTMSNKTKYVLSGGSGSGALSAFQIEYSDIDDKAPSRVKTTLGTRGELPDDCGDAGCIAVRGGLVAVSVNQGDILLLQPTGQ